jgi:hypothetical protein
MMSLAVNGIVKRIYSGFWKTMKVSRAFPFLMFVFMVASIPIGVNLVNRPTRTVSTKAASTLPMMVYLEPSSLEPEYNQPFTVSVKVDTGAAVSGGVFGALTYDSSMLRLVTASSGPFFTNLNINPIKNRINLSATEKVSGVGTIMYVTFIPFSRGSSTIAFSENFELNDKDGELNGLTAQPHSITITVN